MLYSKTTIIWFILTVYSWFAGDLARKEAERLLTPISNEAGTFLIRKSETKPGTFYVY